VKSRWKTKAEGFIITNFTCDFVVIACLNRGSKDGRAEVLPPEFFVLSSDAVRAARGNDPWGKIFFKSIPNLEKCKDGWDAIRNFLKHPNGDARKEQPNSLLQRRGGSAARR